MFKRILACISIVLKKKDKEEIKLEKYITHNPSQVELHYLAILSGVVNSDILDLLCGDNCEDKRRSYCNNFVTMAQDSAKNFNLLNGNPKPDVQDKKA